MRSEQECRYVVLGYADDALVEPVTPIAIVAVQGRSEAQQAVAMRVVTLMPTRMTTAYREYLFELFESWRQTPAPSLDALFRELRELSAGQLRACDFGYCSTADFPGIADQALERTTSCANTPTREGDVAKNLVSTREVKRHRRGRYPLARLGGPATGLGRRAVG